MANEILICISGMGDPETGATDQWARALFPGGALVERANGKTLEVDGRVIHLVEVIYEESNEAIRQKFDVLGRFLPTATPDEQKDTIEDYALDVAENVILRSALDASQVRFVQKYNDALNLARELAGAHGGARQTKIGVLSHSLGTLIAYEGICRAFNTALITSIVDVNVVMCAPMLAPIHHAMQALGANRYLTRNGCAKPYMRTASGRFYTMIRKCLAIYNRRDPFHLIQDMTFYKNSRDNDLIDDFRLFSSATPITRFWEGHSMIDSYIAHNRGKIAEVLFQ